MLTSDDDLNYLEKFTKKLEVETNRYSCLKIALKDARMISGRDFETGQVKNDFLQTENSFLSPYSFIGVINHLLILEIIGEIYKLKSFRTKKNNKIYSALAQFSDLNENDIDVIISLRNCLAHNYGLANIPYDSKEFNTKRHIFILSNTNHSKLIQYPKIIWDGDFKKKNSDMYTTISVLKLFDLIEIVYSDVILNIENGNMKVGLTGGINELKTRFTITH